MKENKFHVLFIYVFSLLVLSACGKGSRPGESRIEIPRAEKIIVDGDPAEWVNIEGFRLWADPLGGYADPGDLYARMKASWKENSLYLLFEVTDNRFFADTLNPWTGDALEVFLAPYRGSENISQLTVVPFTGKGFILEKRYSEGDPLFIPSVINSQTNVMGNKRTTELEIGLLNPGGSDTAGYILKNFALQVYVDDADSGNNGKKTMVWYPVGQSYNTSAAMYGIALTDRRQTIQNTSSRLVITDDKNLELFVFGAVKGDNIGVSRNGVFLENLTCFSSADYLPDTFDISGPGWDIENDTLSLTLNGKDLGTHEIFLSPRLYKNLEPKPFDGEIRNFIFSDRVKFPPENSTLFIGSSSITRWKNLKQYFPELDIIQRGFGGSNSPQALMYMEQIVIPYKPSNIVYYEGDNDIPQGISPEEIRENVRSFIDRSLYSLPGVKIYILSPKPSISRWQFWKTYQKTQILLRELCEEYQNVEYVDVSAGMFDQKGNLDRSIFLEDGLHMNEQGYRIWANIIRKSLGLKSLF